jgi:3-isopropylmalate dehydrogenase
MHVALLPGDGIGPEVTAAARAALEAVAEAESFTVTFGEHAVGWAAVEAGAGSPLPSATLEACHAADAVFLGAVGDPRADDAPRPLKPETGLLALRGELGCWANLRPVRVPDALVPSSALRPDRVAGTDLVVVRELGGGIYYGEPRGDEGGEAWNTMRYRDEEVRRLARLALDTAAERRGRLVSVDKANVLEVSRLWRRVVDDEARRHGRGVEVTHMLVDRAAMELVTRPTAFDVLLTGNLFGDILSDEAGVLPGSLGVLASASLGGTTDLYEPVHGSAPDLVGRGTANPAGAILSLALMLRHTFGRTEAAVRIERAVDGAWAAGVMTPDLGGTATTAGFTEAVLTRVHSGEKVTA